MLITIINNIQEISLVHETLLTYMAKLPLDSEDQKISIAVDEILSNIIFYGFEDHLEHHITLQLKHSEGNIDLEFVDDGVYILIRSNLFICDNHYPKQTKQVVLDSI